MMNNNDQRLAMNDMNGQSVLMPNMDLLPNMSNIMDDQLMQLLDNQNYMMTDGSHLVANQRPVQSMATHAVNNSQNSPMDRHSVESCAYVSNQYDPQYHSSSDSHRFKYRSSGMSSVPETVTHVSETDSSHSGQNNYQNVGNISVQPNYPMNSMNNWSHNQNHNNMMSHQSRGPKDMVMSGGGVQSNHMNTVKVTPPSGYIPRQRMSNFVPNIPSMNPSTTSTPVSQSHNNMIIHNNNHNNIDNINLNKNHSPVMSEGLVMANRVESSVALKRTVIIFKVIDQIVDSSGKVLKETVVKNEEIVRNIEKVDWNESTNSTTPLSSISHVSRCVSNPSSGVLADVSSSVRSTCSSQSESRHNPNNESLTKGHSIHHKKEMFNKTPVPKTPNPVVNVNSNSNNNSFSRDNSFTVSIEPRITANTTTNEMKDNRVKSATNVSNVGIVVENKINEKDEEERRETATALLCLTQRSLNIDCNQNEQTVLKDFAIRPGNKVMAKWRDKNFYPALISKHLPQNNKWSVVFEDKATRSLFETELIQLSHLVEGQEVMVTISEGFCAKSIIKRPVYEANELLFEVEHLKEDKQVVVRYPLKDIFLNAEQGANIAVKLTKPPLNGAVFADVDLDNIVSGKRVRVTTKAEKIIDKPVQQFKNGRRRAVDAVSVDVDYVNDGEEDDEEDDQAFGYKTKKKSNFRNKKFKVESQNMLFNNEHSLSISPRATKVHSSIPATELIKLLGPLPDLTSQNHPIFRSVCFLLTCGDRNSEDLCSEQSNPERSTPFDKLYLTKQIESGGGTVFETYDDMRSLAEGQDMVLIADTYHRSIKYIQCLAAGISIASHLWVIDCCRKNQYLKRDNYTLPAGFSIITNALPSDKNTFKKSSTLFKGTKFYFGSQTPETLHDLWSPVLSAAHAIIVENNSISVTNLSRKCVDIIIGDTTCSVELVKKAKQMKIPVISSEYIVQCLINGRKLSYDASPLFSYTYKSVNL